MQIKKSNIKKVTAISMSCSLAVMLPAVNVAAAGTEPAYEKTENVYSKLNADGSSQDAYVVNDFDISSASTITDYGNYSDLKNLTDLSVLKTGDQSVTFTKEEGKFYYQGTITDVELPWLFDITYTLDGTSVSPDDLAGKSGALTIQIKVTQNPEADPVFYENYVAQISLTLDSTLCKNITAEDATIADAGSDRQISFTLLPDTDGDFTIQTDVTDFSMSGFSIAAVPYSMSIDSESLGTGDLVDQFSELSDAVSQLNDGTGELSDGISELNSGGASLSSGSAQIQSGLQELSNNSATLVDASAQINNALNTISSQLSSADFSSMDSLTQLPDSLDQISGSLSQLESGLEQLYSSFNQSYYTLDQLIQVCAADTGTQLSSDEIANIEAVIADESTDPELSSQLQKLLTSYQYLQQIESTYSQIAPAFEAVSTSLNPDNAESVTSGLLATTSGISTMSTTLRSSLEGVDITSMMNELQSGLGQLSSSYQQFHEGLVAYTDGVTELSSGYSEYNAGLVTYLSGVNELDSGSTELADGMNELNDGVSDMPDEVQNTIDEMMDQYNSDDFDAVSFVDSRNENIESVQFVISTESIELPDEETVEETEEEMGFWARVKSLFSF